MSRKLLTDHPDSAIIESLGGTTAVARMCDIKIPSVSGWKRKGIPQARRMYLRLLHPEAFQSAPSDRAAACDSLPAER
ncbi:hypothetical protein [Castellaniella denitrificans]|uniref:hypothetical protein n=1 Tax=Castellaniella denitrificans TaxID=56119 RepID=UPI0036242929